MEKAKSIFAIMIMVILAYLILIATSPATNAIIETANTTANWTGHADYAKAQAFMLGWRFWSWFIPGPIGIAAVVYVLKFKK